MEQRNLLHRANVIGMRQAGRRSQRHQSRRYLLRSQLGFRNYTCQHPKPIACAGCGNYHGIVYGQRREQRTRFICAMYPSGWTISNTCPDWTPELPPPEHL